MGDIDFSYYKPINAQQEAFHASPAKHKLLIGGYGGGKTYPMIHQVFRHCFENNFQDFAVFKNTWDAVKQSIMQEFLEIGYAANAIKAYDKTDSVVRLANGSRLLFRPLTLQRKELKGLNICGFLCDDPNVDRFEDTISFLFTRLRNSATQRSKARRFGSYFTANWEGHNWLYKTFMQGKEEGEDNNGWAYWIVRTSDNPTLSEDFIENLKSIHSEAWMNRFVYMKNLNDYSGLVYPEFNVVDHDIDCSLIPGRNDMVKIISVDVGFNTTAAVKMATDMKKIYVYDEFRAENCVSGYLGEWLRSEITKDTYRTIVIDPTSNKSEHTSGMSVAEDLKRNYGLRIEGGNNDVRYGIMVVKDLLRPAAGDPLLLMDVKKCPHAKREYELYRRKEPKEAQFDDVGYLETVEKKNDHFMDAIRYGTLYLKKFLRSIAQKEDFLETKRKELWEERLKKLRMYGENPRMVTDWMDREIKRKRNEINKRKVSIS